MDDGCPEPTRWWTSALTGAAFGSPVAAAVLLLADMVSDELGLLFVLFVTGPVLVSGLATAAATAVHALRWPWSRWWWTPALAPGLALVLLGGHLVDGPAGAARERAVGWAVVVLLMSGGVAVVAGGRTAARARAVGLAVVLAAAPAMVAFDHASQYRWRRAALAGVPAVMPVIPGYRAVAARADGPMLGVTMAGPTVLLVRIHRCPACVADDDPHPFLGRAFVVDGYEVRVAQADAGLDTVRALTGVGVRATDRAVLARLPLAPARPYPD